MSGKNNRLRFSDWTVPADLSAASFTAPRSKPADGNGANTPPPEPQKPPTTESQNSQNTNTENSENNSPFNKEGGTPQGYGASSGGLGGLGNMLGGLDPKMLLNIFGGGLGDGNPQIAPLLGMLNGEKPDMMSLLPMIMQMNAKKEKPPAETVTPKQNAPASYSDTHFVKGGINTAPKVINLNEYTIV